MGTRLTPQEAELAYHALGVGRKPTRAGFGGNAFLPRRVVGTTPLGVFRTVPYGAVTMEERSSDLGPKSVKRVAKPLATLPYKPDTGTLNLHGGGMVGMTGFEPATSASRTQRSTKLSHIPGWFAKDHTPRGRNGHTRRGKASYNRDQGASRHAAQPNSSLGRTGDHRGHHSRRRHLLHPPRAKTTNGLDGTPIAAAGRFDLASRQTDSFGSGAIGDHRPARDYDAELATALGRQGSSTAQGFDDENDDSLDVAPLDDAVDGTPAGAPNGPTLNVPAVAGDPNPIAYSTEGSAAAGADPTSSLAASIPANPNPSTSDAGASGNGDANVFDDYGQGGTMSDSDVYRLVVNNLPDGQRDDFARGYAAMSSEQRASLLDGFRQQIQGGN